MRRNEQWFELNGVKSLDFQVILSDAPALSLPVQRSKSVSVAGRDGCLFLADEGLNCLEIQRSCRIPASMLRSFRAWLSANESAALRFSCETDAIYQAKLSGGVSFKQITSDQDPIFAFSLLWICQPMPHLYPPAEELVFTSSGVLENPCTAESLPRISIEGSGAFSLSIGAQRMFFREVEEGVIVDSELCDALTLDASLLANEWVEGDFFRIPAGESSLSFEIGGEDEEGNILSGEISKITILPRWRWL